MVCKTAMKEELVCCVKDHSQDMWIFLAHTWGPHMPGWVQVDERENSWRWHQTLTGCLTFGEWPHFSESQLSWVLNWVTGLWITNTSPNGRWCTLCTHSEMTLTLGKKYEGLFKTLLKGVNPWLFRGLTNDQVCFLCSEVFSAPPRMLFTYLLSSLIIKNY